MTNYTKKLLCLTLVAAVIMSVHGCGYSLYPSQESLDQQELRPFMVNGKESSTEIIERNGNDYFLSGFVVARNTRLDSSRGTAMSVLIVPETLGGITVYHAIPFLENDSTVRNISNDTEIASSLPNAVIISRDTNVDESDLLVNTFNQNYTYNEVEIVISNNIFYARRILEYVDVYYPADDFSGDLGNAGEFLETMRYRAKRADLSQQYWMDLTRNNSVELRGMSVGGDSRRDARERGVISFLNVDYDAVLHLQIPDVYRGVSIYHIVRIHFGPDEFERHYEGEDVTEYGLELTVPVRAGEGRIDFAPVVASQEESS
ncbi:MAG: hypothetical protein FWD93_05520 [Coriobacteriia bacterium]|nr:hypothetical protein [Coriobacteriia bacterium]